jgi:hypothetical protein
MESQEWENNVCSEQALPTLIEERTPRKSFPTKNTTKGKCVTPLHLQYCPRHDDGGGLDFRGDIHSRVVLGPGFWSKLLVGTSVRGVLLE